VLPTVPERIAHATRSGALDAPVVMHVDRISRSPALWAAIAVALLAIGFLAAAFALGWAPGLQDEGTDLDSTRMVLTAWARVMLPKALAPHLLLTLGTFAGVERLPRVSAWSIWPRRAMLFAIAVGVAVPLVAYWLPSTALGTMRVTTPDAASFVSTCFELAAASTFAALAARALLDRTRRAQTEA